MHVKIPDTSKPMLAAQEQLAVSLYLKTMNKTQAARDAGYASTAVFNKPHVQAAIEEQMLRRAERLRIGADWILIELKRCYDTSVSLCDMRSAMRALDLIGKHCDIQAWAAPVEDAGAEVIRDRLMRARHRAVQPPQEGSAIGNETKTPEAPPVSFMEPPPPAADVPDFRQLMPEDDTLPDEPEAEILSPRMRELLDRLRGIDEDIPEFEPVPEPVSMRARGDVVGREPVTFEAGYSSSFDRCYE